MSHLKEDEWPGPEEPTTTERQQRPGSPARQDAGPAAQPDNDASREQEAVNRGRAVDAADDAAPDPSKD